MDDATPSGDAVFEDERLIDFAATVGGVDMSDPVSAFLYMIRSCEHRFPDDVADDACYGIFYGGSHFFNFSDHPVTTGEKSGVKLPAEICVKAGYPSGNCVSTAAGAYQFTRPTWDRLRKLPPYLTDFGAENQDAAAVRLLTEIGALHLIQAGNVQAAIAKASQKWASLPGAGKGQHEHTIEYALTRFNEGGLA